MTSQVTLQVTVDPSGAVVGTGRVTSSIRNMTTSANANLSQLQKSFSDLDRFINRSSNSLSNFLKIAAVSYGVKSLLDRLIEVNTMYTQFTATLEAVKGSATAAADEFEYLLATSNRLGQNVELSTKNYMRLAASMKHVDSTGESTRHVFEGVATAASVLHLKGYEANGILIAFEQILSKNKLSLEEVQRQLSNRMPDAMGTAARAMNMTQVEFRKGITEGTIHPLEFVLRMANQLKIEYGDAAKKTADSFIGQQARMHNAVMNLYRTVGQSGAMEGLTAILKAVTDMMNDPNTGTALGQSLNDLFTMIADWISTITASDITDFFDGLGGVVKSFVIIMRDLVDSFDDTVDGQADFLSFSRAVANGMLTMIEVAHTLVAGILAIPAALKWANAAYEVFGRVTSPKALGLFQSDQEKSDYSKKTDEAVAKMNKAEADMGKLMNKFLVDGRLNGARKGINDTFDQLENRRTRRQSSQKFPINPDIMNGSGGLMSEDKVRERAAEGGPKPKPKPKGTGGRKGEDVFNTESVALAKAAAQSMLEYNNALNDVLGSENKYITQLEVKFRYDKNFMKLSSEKKDALRSLAREADLAAAKEAGAQAFASDRLALNKGIYNAELDLIDVLEHRNSAETANQRVFEEKLKFDAKYKTFSDDMIKVEREKAKALDDLTVKIERARKAEESRYATQVLLNQVMRDSYNYERGLGPNKYNEVDKVKDSIQPGGQNFNLDAQTKNKLFTDATTRDTANMTRDMEAFRFGVQENLRVLQEESDLVGQSTWAIQKYTETKKILDFFRQNGIDLQDEENYKWREMADLMISDVSRAYDVLEEKSHSWQRGMASGLQMYIDQINNVTKNMEEMTIRVFKGMEDALVDFIMTGEFNFRDFATMVIRELVRMMVQMTIIKPMMEAMQFSMFGAGGMFFAKGGAFVDGKRYYAKGDSFGAVVDSPTNFMVGQMGEGGKPEAVMPLTRDSSGRLGVRAQGTGGGATIGDIVISVNVYQDGQSEETSTGKGEGADLAEKIKAVALSVIHEELRQGGSLSKAR